MSTYTITLINSEVYDSNEYTSLEEAIESAKILSNICLCSAVITRDDGVDVVFIGRRFKDRNNIVHDTSIEYLE